jgi:hypothetical protein
MTSPTAIRITRCEGVALDAKVGDGYMGGVAVADAEICGCEAVMEEVTACVGFVILVIGVGEALTDGVAVLF